jgi:RHS repeat-associated protein
VYVGNVEEVSTTGSTTTTTTYYYAAGQRFAEAVNGVFSYLGSDGLGSAEVALDGSGNAQASVLYGPYGAVRYSSGAMPGSYAFTGQRADATTGLDYYNARYYDPVAGQFVSADTVQDGLNRYGYVHGNPETATDPTGHRAACGQECGIGGGGRQITQFTVDCASDIAEYYDQCDDYRYDLSIRNHGLDAMYSDASKDIFFGLVIGAALDLVELWYTSNVADNAIATLEAVVDLCIDIATGFTYGAKAFGWNASALNNGAALAMKLAEGARYVIAFIRENGPWVPHFALWIDQDGEYR